jgi:5'-AMP-activated protein kinase catalytic alpha subunit
MDEEEAAGLFAQLFDAVLHLRTKGIAHRDIKPENIIVAGDRLTLIDFGLGRMYGEGERLSTSCGSPCYAAPEMMTAKTYDAEKT